MGADVVGSLANADVLLVYGGPILSREVFQAPRLGAYNFHPSLLPRHRGREPERAVLASGDREGGVTLHRITEKVDRGPILLQRRFPLRPDETIESYKRRALDTIVAMLSEAIQEIAGASR